jgi:magnesium transporter
MRLERRLADGLVRSHPVRAAAVLERAGAEDGASIAARLPAEVLAPVLGRMTPQGGVAILLGLPDEKAARVLETLELDRAARFARRLPPERLAAVLARMPERRAGSLESLLRFPENTAGALMDPEVLALAEGLTSREALGQVRENAEQARYNLYVVDAEQTLVGALNLRELLLARSRARLADLMVRNPVRLRADDDRAAIVAHPGWREVHSLPVVDATGGYLGAVRYRTLRALEEELLGRAQRDDHDVRTALGDLFSVGAGGLLDALGAVRDGEPR